MSARDMDNGSFTLANDAESTHVFRGGLIDVTPSERYYLEFLKPNFEVSPRRSRQNQRKLWVTADRSATAATAIFTILSVHEMKSRKNIRNVESFDPF